MKYFLPVSVLFLILLYGCSNKLNIAAPYKDITVVYGLLDQNDSIHYIRINKGYSPIGNAYVMAAQFDSIYYPYNDISGEVDDYNNGVLKKVYPLDTITTIPLNPGIFSNPKQVLYYFKAPST